MHGTYNKTEPDLLVRMDWSQCPLAAWVRENVRYQRQWTRRPKARVRKAA